MLLFLAARKFSPSRRLNLTPHRRFPLPPALTSSLLSPRFLFNPPPAFFPRVSLRSSCNPAGLPGKENHLFGFAQGDSRLLAFFCCVRRVFLPLSQLVCEHAFRAFSIGALLLWAPHDISFPAADRPACSPPFCAKSLPPKFLEAISPFLYSRGELFPCFLSCRRSVLCAECKIPPRVRRTDVKRSLTPREVLAVWNRWQFDNRFFSPIFPSSVKMRFRAHYDHDPPLSFVSPVLISSSILAVCSSFMLLFIFLFVFTK